VVLYHTLRERMWRVVMSEDSEGYALRLESEIEEVRDTSCHWALAGEWTGRKPTIETDKVGPRVTDRFNMQAVVVTQHWWERYERMGEDEMI
jgi:hypothetical protein